MEGKKESESSVSTGENDLEQVLVEGKENLERIISILSKENEEMKEEKGMKVSEQEGEEEEKIEKLERKVESLKRKNRELRHKLKEKEKEREKDREKERQKMMNVQEEDGLLVRELKEELDRILIENQILRNKVKLMEEQLSTAYTRRISRPKLPGESSEYDPLLSKIEKRLGENKSKKGCCSCCKCCKCCQCCKCCCCNIL